MESQTPAIYNHPSAWKSIDIAKKADDWTISLSEADNQELDNALQHVKKAGKKIPEIKREDFPLASVAEKLKKVLHLLEEGSGFSLIRGLSIENYSKSDIALIYWGIGTYLGPAFAQNAQGDMLGHVRDLGANWKTEVTARGYQTRQHLPFHNDSTDVVGLICLQPAKAGGESRLVSSTSIHNELVAKRPDLWKILCQPFYVDRRGEESEGQKPYYITPCFSFHKGRLFIRYNRAFIESAQRFDDVPRLTLQQIEALDYVDQLCNDPSFYYDMRFNSGDIQFLCNYVTLHSRSDYEDWPERHRKRHLLRLWLRTPGFQDLPAAFADRNADMTAWQKTPRPPVFDDSEIQAELAH